MNAMTCERFENEVGGWLDGELDAGQRAAMDAHRASCDACSALVTDLRRLATEARALAELAPARDLWAGIEARIEAPVIPLGESAPGTAPARRSGRRWQVAPQWLAAAAAALIVASSGVTYVLTRESSVVAGDPVANEQWVMVDAGLPVATASASGRSVAEQDHDDQIRLLRAAIAERRGALDTATVATVERALRVIDDAIAESRAALERDPGSEFLHEQLDRTLGRKVELLRTLALMPARS
ncbi:MAG TPA: zf-HC2 domain-containing protein [Gemmatimonadaceae bacterium]|nr:zf-HC2 domain-containing protein [Gemmatimonadaceae bacterium]